MTHHDNSIQAGRRRFLRTAGILAAAGALASCGVKSSSEASDETGEGGITKRRNPNTGDEVSLLGFGCMRFPTLGLRNGTDDDTLDQEAINELIDAALEGGVNYFDTSPSYCKGQSEAAIGTALARHPRENYFIATKLSNFNPATWSREKSEEMFANSLRNLQTDYVDYLLLHGIGMGGMENWNGRYIANGMLEFLKEQRSKGVIRNLGFSYHGDVAVFDLLLEMMDRGEVKWDFAQIQLNYLDWHHAKEINQRNTNAEYLYGELHRRGIPAVIMEPLLGGRLASVPQPITRKMKERRPDHSIASWAFRYAGTPEGVLTVLSGMNRMEHLRDNLGTFSPLQPLSADEDAFLQRCATEILENEAVPCTDCKYCMPCPYGVDIPGVFAHYNRCINEDFVPRDTLDPNYDRARRAFLYGYDKAVPRLRQASHCIACGACVSHCPQTIPIPATLRKIDRYAEALRQNTLNS